MNTPTSVGYLSDLSDAEWEQIPPLLPPPAARGRLRQHSLRTILNAIFSVVRAGGAWRLLPCDLPPWKTVYHSFSKWRRDGTQERTFAWQAQARRLSKDDELLCSTSAALIYIRMIRLMLRRLTRR